ncbi:MAG: hypothetical protein PGN23_00515 [Sphingomonas adhaesiva]|uniref:PepSY domain-containing protein n=1 Tax=Sphingomonas adhaesiva TaxID=28212 RepID=UPI002FFB8C74
MSARRTMRRVHLWLGWVVGVPLIFWTASGLWMVARPIAEVRGTALRAAPPALALPSALAAPRAAGATAAAIEMQHGTPRWIVTLPGGAIRRADAATGRLLPGVERAEALALARASVKATAPIVSVTRFAADAAPLDLRRARPSWQVAYDDGTHAYLDADTGTLLAIRTPQWRAFDWMWGLHIMDLGGREDTSHAILIASAALALVASVLGMVLLPVAVWRRRRRT